MRAAFIIFFICFCAELSYGQASMVKGYIVTAKGDTLKGEARINPKKEIDNYYKVSFKDETGIQKIYKPNKILAYGYDNEHFRAMDSQDEKSFYKVLASGGISLFRLDYETMRMNALVVETEYYISVAGDKDLILVKESRFKKQAAELMKDNPDFINTYGDEKKLNCEKAVEVITQYNSWKAGK